MLDTETKLKIIHTLIVSNFQYCNTIYHYCNVTDTTKMEKVLKRALRFAFHDFHSDYKELLRKANCESLYICRIRDILVNVHKVKLNVLPPIKRNFFQENDTVYKLRGANLIQPMYNTIKYGFNSFRYNGPMLYNKLPTDFKNRNLIDFKSAIRDWKPSCCECNSCFLCSPF